MYKDITLTCVECGEDFTFTASEQEFYAEKGFTNQPKRCNECRNSRKKQQKFSGGGGGGRQMYETVCAECNATTQVPFKPVSDKPVYCNDCFRSRRGR